MRVLISAYACEPGKGSEPGAGWAWAVAAARSHEVCVLTRANNRDAIEGELALRPVAGLRFVYVDLPAWARRWKRGQRGVRLYFVLWQLAAARAARRLHRRRRFDVVHHLTFANLWLPALVWLVPAPFVLGPVGGGVRVPLRHLPALGARGAAREAVLAGQRRLSSLNPLVRLGWRRAAVILVQNDETRAALPRRARARAIVRPNACALDARPAFRSVDRARPTLVYAGRLVAWKGVGLAIAALRRLPGWRLVIVGSGPDRRRLERLARAVPGGSVRFVPWLPREELWRLVASADALVVPSLREEASFVAVEARALGVPVVAFDRGGPAALAARGARVELAPLRAPAASASALAAAARRARTLRVGTDDTAAFGLEGVREDVDRAYRLACTPPPLSAGALA